MAGFINAKTEPSMCVRGALLPFPKRGSGCCRRTSGGRRRKMYRGRRRRKRGGGPFLAGLAASTFAPLIQQGIGAAVKGISRSISRRKRRRRR